MKSVDHIGHRAARAVRSFSRTLRKRTSTVSDVAGRDIHFQLREDGKEKEESKMEVGKEIKEEIGKECVKEDVSVPFLWRLWVSSVKGEIRRVVVVFLGETFGRSLRTSLIVSLRLGWMCLWCLM